MIKKIAIFQKKERYTMEQNLTFADLGLSAEVLHALDEVEIFNVINNFNL